MSPDAEGAGLVESTHRFMRGMEQFLDGHHRRRELDRVRRRLRAGDGLRLPDRGRVGQLRPAGDQPGDHPGLRRHPTAAPAGGRGQGAGDEPGRRPGRRLRGSPGRAREPGGARPRAVRRRAVLGAQARRPGADRDRGDQARSAGPTSTRAWPARPRASRGRSAPRTPRRASAPSSASAGRTSRAGEADGRRHVGRTPGRAARARASGRWSLTGAGVSVPSGSPTSAARAPACGRTWTRWKWPTSTPGGAIPTASGASTASVLPR